MVTCPLRMPQGALLAQFWQFLLKCEDLLLAQPELGDLCEVYLRHLLSVHPPGQHRLVDTEYAHFIKALGSTEATTFGLWQHVESLLESHSFMASFLVDLLVADLCAFLSTDSNSGSSPFFLQLFWPPSGTGNHMTRPVRRLVKMTMYPSRIWEVQLKNLTCLLHLASTVCVDLTTELVLGCKRLPTPQLLRFVSHLHSTSLQWSLPQLSTHLLKQADPMYIPNSALFHT